MRSVLQICDIKTISDVINLKNSIASIQGVLACQIDKEKGEAEVIYNEHFLNLDKLIYNLEEMGFIVM
ncbi:MAG: ferredoxin [Clostridium sp.]|nr:ferredoxin [Clostridium sp.]